MKHTDHEAPLRWLATKLHEGRTLAERIKRLRYKRRKPAQVPVGTPELEELLRKTPLLTEAEQRVVGQGQEVGL